MREFAYARPEHAEEAVRLVAAGDAAYLAGGTNLVDLMKLGVARPGSYPQPAIGQSGHEVKAQSCDIHQQPGTGDP